MIPPIEIKALEEALAYKPIAGKEVNCGMSVEYLSSLVVMAKATASYLELLKGEHETDVIVPREPTGEMKLLGARSIGRTMTETNHTVRSKACYVAMITASQEAE